MQRVAFLLRLRPGTEEAYDQAHKEVWPEMLAALKNAGISDYSIFRRERDLVLCFRVDDFEKAWERLDRDPVNCKWQESMKPLFEEVGGRGPAERFAMMKEVFYLA